MINRQNWKLVSEYLKYRRDFDQISKKSQRLEESRLRHLLEWAKDTPFDKVTKLHPTFPEYILNIRIDGKSGSLSPNYVEKVIRAAYCFYKWVTTHKRGYVSLNQIYLDTLKLPIMENEKKEHEAVTIEEIRAIAKAPVTTLGERRIRASAIFWFLSGIRIGAFVSLPLAAVDLDNLSVKQWPKLGVRTKFKKRATTFLLNIPDLLEVVKEWDNEVRNICGNDGLWFAQVSPETCKIIPGAMMAGEFRSSIATRDLKQWLKKVGLLYHSPHKFRHGNAVYSLKNSKNIHALKAVSQNLMHSNISITDGVYGILSTIDVQGEIASLGNKIISNDSEDVEDLKFLVKKILLKLDDKTIDDELAKIRELP
jgi:integrase